MKYLHLLTLLLVLCFTGTAQAQQYGPTRLKAVGTPYIYPSVSYNQSVVRNASTAYNNVVNFHWRRGNGTNYVVLAGLYRQRAPYNGTYPTPYPPFSNPPAGPGNGYMDANSRMPTYAPDFEVAPYLIKTGSYSGNASDTTAQVLNARPGETYYAYIWEYVNTGNGPQVLPAPPGANLSWQALFTQFYPLPKITTVVANGQNQAVLNWTTAAEDTLAGFRIILAPDSTTTNGTLSAPGRTIMLSTVKPAGFATTVTSYSQTLPVPLSATTWYQIVPFLTPQSTYIPNAPLYSPPRPLVAYRDPTLAPLPVTLVDFTARRPRPAGAAVWVDWSTASELNNAGFDVERSLNGTSWQQVVTVAGNGTTAQGHRYTVTDSCQTAAYYRLVQRDLDGTQTYSPVRYVAASGRLMGELALQVYPNPAQTVVHLFGTDPLLPLVLLNAIGQPVRQFAPATVELDVAMLPRGFYLLQQGARRVRLVLQ